MAHRTTPVLTTRQLALIMAPLLAMAAAAIVCGNQAAGLVAGVFTGILWAAIEKLLRPEPLPPAPPPPRPMFVGPKPPSDPPRPVFVGPEPPAKFAGRARKLRALADDERAPAGERAAAREALRRLETQR